MQYYHIYIVAGGFEYREIDQTETYVQSLVDLYMKGEKISFGGKVFDPSIIEKIQVYQTSERMADVTTAVEVTNDFFTTPRAKHANRTKRQASSALPLEKKVLVSKKIFIVHGRDHTPMKELKTILLELGLKPIVLHEQPSGSRTIVEKLEKYSSVGYAFVVLTPDDLGISSESVDRVRKIVSDQVFEAVTDPDGTKAPYVKPYHDFLELFGKRARQNVVLEFGYFIGLLGRDRVCCLYKGNVELPSDMHGIVYMPFNESVEEIRLKIMKELQEAGYKIKL